MYLAFSNDLLAEKNTCDTELVFVTVLENLYHHRISLSWGVWLDLLSVFFLLQSAGLEALQKIWQLVIAPLVRHLHQCQEWKFANLCKSL